MKKTLAVIGLLVGMAVASHAGTPRETLFQGQAPLSNQSIVGTTYTVTGGAIGNLQASVAPGVVNGVSCRNCFTRILVSLGTNSTFYINDQITGGAGTTNYVIYGNALGALGTNQTANTLSLPEDHLGPLCFTAGNNTIFNILAPTAANGPGISNTVDYEGYTSCGGTNNAGN